MVTETLFIGDGIHPVVQRGRDAPEAVLVRGNRIAFVGSITDARDKLNAATRIVDLDGRSLLPGFVDAHCHPLMHGQFESWVDCGWESAATIDGVVAALARQAGRASTGPVRGRGFHHGNVAEQRMLTRHDLDRVATDREVLVFHSSGHGAIVNTWALQCAGITAATPDPDGGHFGRDDDGTPNGQVWDAAADALTGAGGVKIANNGPNFHLGEDAAQLTAHLASAQGELHEVGVTTVVDAQVTGRELATYQALRQAGGLTLRVEMLMISSLVPELEALGIGGRLGDDVLAISGVKLYVDGALTGATARFAKPYCCDPTDFGYLYHDTSELAQLLERVRRLGLVSATHAQGDEAIEILLGLHERLGADPARRHRIEHFGSPTPEHIQRTTALGLWAIMQPQYVRRYGDELARALGDRAERIKPAGECVAAGTSFALSSDAPVCPPNPLEAIHAAITRRTISGRVLGGAEQQLDLETAIRAHTLGGAASIHREASVGSLEPGKLADLVVLDGELHDDDIDGLLQLRVAETWSDGRIVYDASRHGAVADSDRALEDA